MKVTNINQQTFGAKLSTKSHKNMLALLKKMHAEDTYTQTSFDKKATSICELRTGNLNINTCKLPTVEPSKLNSDEFVSIGVTHFIFNKGKSAETIIEVNNKDGEVKTIYDRLNKGWKNWKKELAKRIDETLKNYDTSSVEKERYSMRGN